MRCAMTRCGAKYWSVGTLTVLSTLSFGAAPPAVRADEPPKTLKERLSDKASDEQRVDNCRVPVDRRGSKPRPDCKPSAAKSVPRHP